ncbi:MAG: hypothetical protein EBR05_09565 [Marivivens sp.]|nr:hypothetical protein [Marivivens sp.]
MGVRLREAMGSRSRGESGTVVGLDELLIQIGRVGDFPKDYDITPGTLRRSIGVRNSRGSRINVFVGPRAGGVAIKNDGWFAGIVESGHVGGRNRSIGSVNFNKIVPAIMRLRPIAERLMVIHMRQVFDKYKL